MFQVDAFADRVFTGNPAAVCPLDAWLSDDVMQGIAAENNLAETAFFVPEDGGFRLRWFTPATEVDLCGHATLASAYVLFNHLAPGATSVRFNTRSGELIVTREDDGLLAMDFPSRPPRHCDVHADLLPALGRNPESVLAARDYLVVYPTEQEVREIDPDMKLLSGLDRFAVIITAPGRDCDFVSRFFAPAQGVPEDPVTGSAHCTLTPYWAERLCRDKLHARQVSRRGGELWCELRGNRVRMAGRAVEFLRGEICVA